VADDPPGGVAGHAVQVSLDPQERPRARDGGAVGEGFLAMAQGNAPKGATVKILEYKDMEPFFIKGERDEP
jgi:hypothetical protein